MTEMIPNIYNRLLALEGCDGAGKGTQSKMTQVALTSLGYNVMVDDYPHHNEPSAAIADRFLRGEYGDPKSIHPDLISATFLLDRIYSKQEIIDFLSEDPMNVVLLDRYVASNLAHNGARIDEKDERFKFYLDWYEREFGVFALPKPALNIALLVDEITAQENVDKKNARNYTNVKRDVNEADKEHLRLTVRNYIELATEVLPHEFTAIWAIKKHIREMRDPEEITQDILDAVLPVLQSS